MADVHVEPTLRRSATLEALLEAAIVAVIRADSERDARALAEGLIVGGIRALEITVPTPGCFAILRELESRVSGSVQLGAGTVKTAAELARARDAGASFIVSPHTDPALIEATVRAGCVSIPGALTPTEILAAQAAGADVVKVFPVSAVGGARYVRLVRGPIPEVRLWVSGNVAIEEIGEMMEAGVSLIGLTSALTGDLGADTASALRDRVRRAQEQVEMVRQGRWLLYVRGPMSIVKIGLRELRALPAEEHVQVEAMIPGRRGQGVRVRRFLEGAGITPESEVELTTEDGSFKRSVRADLLAKGGVLHYATDGQTLDRASGGPLRLYIAGGEKGCDNVKGLSQITWLSR